MKPIERPCLPAVLQQLSDDSERRKQEALARIVRKIEGPPNLEEQELRALQALIDADKRKANGK